MLAFSISLFLLSIPQVWAWGFLGHRTVAYLAQLHFTPSAEAWIESLLNNQDISEAAIWPDKIAHLPWYSYTRAWHYIDAQDDPPRVCKLNFTRDCSGDCAVSALVNHTARVRDWGLSHRDQGESLKFLMHFVGDIHQPLHTENLSRGGNEIPVVFDGVRTNLHSVWDSYMPKKHINVSDEVLGARVWAAKLFRDDELTECIGDMKTCSMEWAAEANQIVCDVVLKDGVEGLSEDLGTGMYFVHAVPALDMQVQRAGRRLAAWINYLAPPLVIAQEL